jgi:hypothetical protein
MEESDLQRGCKLIDRKRLGLIPVPEATKSYTPVSHLELADKLLAVSQGVFTDFCLVGENYVVSRQGQQLFALLRFKGEDSEIDLSLAFRNSYDKFMSVGLVVGANISFCDSLALPSNIAAMKKHTKNVWAELEDMAIVTLHRGRLNYEKVITDAKRLKEILVSNHEAFQLMGLLRGYDIMSPRQQSALKGEWLHPSRIEYRERNMWSFFSAAMECLKTSSPLAIMEKHIKAYKLLVEGCVIDKQSRDKTNYTNKL